jgi:hypothetical protein
MNILREIIARMASGATATEVGLGEIPGHVRIGGIGFGLLGWAIELKGTILADVDPVVHCRNLGEALWTYVHLTDAQYLGMVAWNLIFLVTSFALIRLLKAVWPRRQGRTEAR